VQGSLGSEASWNRLLFLGDSNKLPSHHMILTYGHIDFMVCHTKTTLQIDETVMARLRQEAARQRKTMSELVEAGLRLLFQQAKERKKKQLPRLPTWHGGKPRVDIADRNALYDLMER